MLNVLILPNIVYFRLLLRHQGDQIHQDQQTLQPQDVIILIIALQVLAIAVTVRAIAVTVQAIRIAPHLIDQMVQVLTIDGTAILVRAIAVPLPILFVKVVKVASPSPVQVVQQDHLDHLDHLDHQNHIGGGHLQAMVIRN